MNIYTLPNKQDNNWGNEEHGEKQKIKTVPPNQSPKQILNWFSRPTNKGYLLLSKRETSWVGGGVGVGVGGGGCTQWKVN